MTVSGDLESPDGMPAVRELISRADVFLHNTAPGVIDRLGVQNDRGWRTVGTEAVDVRGLRPPMNFRHVELPMGAVRGIGASTA